MSNLAGLLTYPIAHTAFPSFTDSDAVCVTTWGNYSSGSVQDSHLIPF